MMELKYDWTFVCKVCGKIIEHDKPPPGLEFTRCCGKNMQRVYSESKSFNINGGAYLRTKYSGSLAVSMSQIEEHKQIFPDVKIDNQGRPGFDNVRQQDKYLEASGMVKHPQKIRKLKQLS
jgi:hypothetical protein